MEKPCGEPRRFQAFQPRAIIFGFSLGMFVLTCVHDLQLAATSSHFFSGNAENQVATFLLVIASLGLLVRRWWSHLFAIVASGRVFYMTGYLPLWIFANVELQGGSLLSVTTWKKWFLFTITTQPQYLLHAIVGAIICAYAAVALAGQIISGIRSKSHTG